MLLFLSRCENMLRTSAFFRQGRVRDNLISTNGKGFMINKYVYPKIGIFGRKSDSHSSYLRKVCRGKLRRALKVRARGEVPGEEPPGRGARGEARNSSRIMVEAQKAVILALAQQPSNGIPSFLHGWKAQRELFSCSLIQDYKLKQI